MAESSKDKVFQNSVIWDTLGSFLSYRELADLRQLNSIIRNSIDDSEFFKEKCWRNFFMLPSSPQELIPQDDSSMVCRNVKIVFVTSLPSEAQNRSRVSSSAILSSMKGLKISQFIQSPRTPYGFGQKTIAPAFAFQRAMETILREMRSLETFSSNILLMCKLNLDEFGQDFRRLKKVVIFRPGTSSTSVSSEELDRLIKNMTLLSKNVNKLQNFGFVDNSIGVVGSAPLMTSISSTLKNNIANLHILEIMLPGYWKVSSAIADLIFPSLTAVKIQATYESRNDIAKFLGNQPLLEQLKLAWKDYFPKVVYDVLSRKSSKLRLLHVKAISFGPSEDVGNWDFLGHLTSLEDFEIKSQQKESSIQRHGALGTYQEILQILPPNSIRRLHIRGLPSNRTSLENSMLLRFPNLQEIRLFRCADILNDNILQSLFSNQGFCNRVFTFEFSHCDGITNYGLNGSCSVNNMKYLKRLTVKKCPNITDAFLNRLSLPNLKFLDISSNKKLNQNAIADVVLRCPRLEMLRSSWKMKNHIQSLHLGQRFIRLLLVDDRHGAYDMDSGSE